MPDEYLIGIGIVGKQPPVPIGSAAVNLSGPNTHAELAPYFTRTLVKAYGRWRRNVAARNGGPSWYRRRGSSNARSAEFGCMDLRFELP